MSGSWTLVLRFRISFVNVAISISSELTCECSVFSFQIFFNFHVFIFLVLKEGLEPSPKYLDCTLNAARLPIPPYEHFHALGK